MGLLITDIETSGISATKNGILSLGAVDFDTGEEFYGECRTDRALEPKALEINGFTEEDCRDPNKISDVALYLKFVEWAAGRKLLGGHNIGHFDIIFLEEIHSRSGLGKFPFSYRTVDLFSVAFARFREELSHEQICVKLGLPPEPKPHNALYGARSEKDALKTLLA